MDLTDADAVEALAAAVASADAVVPVGARTQWEVGNPPPARRRGQRARPASCATSPPT